MGSREKKKQKEAGLLAGCVVCHIDECAISLKGEAFLWEYGGLLMEMGSYCPLG